MGNTFGGKLGSLGGKAILLGHMQRWNHHCNLSLPTHQCWQLTSRERFQRGWPFERQMCQAIEKDPSQGRPLSACCTKQQRKTNQRHPLNTSCNRLEKDSNSAIAPAPEAAGIPAHLVPPGSPWSKEPCHFYSRFTGAELPEATKNHKSTIFPVPMAAGSSEYRVLPGSLQSKQLYHLHTWSSLQQAQVLQGSSPGVRSKPL